MTDLAGWMALLIMLAVGLVICSAWAGYLVGLTYAERWYEKELKRREEDDNTRESKAD